MKKSKLNPDDQFEKAYQIMARIVRDYGDIALPTFQRLHEEREKLRANQDLKSIALNVANSGN